MLSLIREAQHAINVSIFFLTSKAIGEELMRAQARGMQVRVILDATGTTNAYSKHDLLHDTGIAVKIETWGGKMHAKAASFDAQHLLLDSMNWTAAGQYANDKNTLVFREAPDLVAYYDQRFEALWRSIPDLYLTWQPRPEGRESGTACHDGIDNDFDAFVDAEDWSCLPGAAPLTEMDCPPKAPLKGNASSRVFHPLEGEHYARTKPGTCFASETEAAAAGFRRSR